LKANDKLFDQLMFAISLDFYKRAHFDIRGVMAAGVVSKRAVSQNEFVVAELFLNGAMPRLSITDHPAFVTRYFPGLLARISQPTNFKRTHVSSRKNKKSRALGKVQKNIDEKTESRLWTTFIERFFSALAWCIYGEVDETEDNSPISRWN
jgi:hypothetical protein